MTLVSRSPAGKFAVPSKSSLPPTAWLRAFGCVAVLALVSACAGGPQVSATQEASDYASRARGDYRPPGPPSDPWGPYIREASKRFDVPDSWIRAVMRQESGGSLYRNGRLITSSAGAMGLMQVMPGTYDELRERHGLGPDPFDPHENIMAGTAYLREMYDIYGSPGFLAAYNAGPNRLDDYLSNNRTLPDETRKYVAAISPRLAAASPNRPSPAQQYAMNDLPTYIPAGTRYGRNGVPPVDITSVAYRTNTGSAVAIAARQGSVPAAAPGAVQIAQLPEPPRAPEQPRAEPLQVAEAAPPPPSAPAPVPVRIEQVAMAAPSPQPLPAPPAPAPTPEQQVAFFVPPAPPQSRFHLIASAQAAEPVPMRRPATGTTASGRWAIQVGAFGSESLAHAALGSAKDHARDPLSTAHASVSTVHQPKGTLYRARMVGLSREAAVQACEKLSRKSNCIVLSPDAQS